jgi:hypothetical protein
MKHANNKKQVRKTWPGYGIHAVSTSGYAPSMEIMNSVSSLEPTLSPVKHETLKFPCKSPLRDYSNSFMEILISMLLTLMGNSNSIKKILFPMLFGLMETFRGFHEHALTTT